MTAKPDLNAISESRIAQADQVFRRRKHQLPGRDLINDATAITHLPAYPARTEKEAAEAERREAEDRRAAARTTVRLIMGTHGCMRPGCAEPRRGESLRDAVARHPIGGHGCSGPGCRRPGHAEAAARVLLALVDLDLMPAPRAS